MPYSYVPPVGGAPLDLGGTTGDPRLDLGAREVATHPELVVAARTGGALATIACSLSAPSVSASVAARTGGARAAVAATVGVPLSISARTAGSVAAMAASSGLAVEMAARTGGARAAIACSLDPPGNALAMSARTGGARSAIACGSDANLIGHLCGSSRASWSRGSSASAAGGDRFAAAPRALASGAQTWRDATRSNAVSRPSWRDADRAHGRAVVRWGCSERQSRSQSARWTDSPRALGRGSARWQTARLVLVVSPLAWRQLPRATAGLVSRCQTGLLVVQRLDERWSGGRRQTPGLRSRWQQAGYPLPGTRGPAVRPPTPWRPRSGRLCLGGPVGVARLDLGRSGCCPALLCVYPQRSYIMRNTASLWRLSDGAEIPVLEMELTTDADSWGWSLRATLAGPGLAMVQPTAPAYLPIEVEARINGYAWQALLELPKDSRKFGSRSITVEGVSRSGWLGSPYTAATSGRHASQLDLRQAADAALDNTGWLLDWDLPDWNVPGGLIAWDSQTVLDRLVALVRPVDGCLYTDPALSILTAYPRYPEPAWTWVDLVADVAIPELAVLSMAREPQTWTLANAVWIGGTLAGALAECRISGTAGDLLAEQVIDPLLCDTAGVAARARAISVLSQCGPGRLVSVETILPPDNEAPGLLRPGLLLQAGTEKGRVRRVTVRATGGDGGLKVRQSVTLEVREAR